MGRMRERSFDELIALHTSKGNKVFGVCLGMQLLFNESEESPGCLGLGVLSGKVRRLSDNARVPNVGWMDATYIPNPNWRMNLSKTEYYFVHSYAAHPDVTSEILATSCHGDEDFTSAIISDKAFGVQFHPEKSSVAGEQLLFGLIDWASDAKG